jgi:hypothetical protein
VRGSIAWKDDELTELARLDELCPLMRSNDAPACPSIEVPQALRMRFSHYWDGASIKTRRFNLLRKVECVRFVELCTQYGWQEGTLPDDTMLPVSQWDPKDRSELQNLLDISRGDYGDDPYDRVPGGPFEATER